MRRICRVIGVVGLVSAALAWGAPSAAAMERAAWVRPPREVCPTVGGGPNGAQHPVCASWWFGEGDYPDASACVGDPLALVVPNTAGFDVVCVWTAGEQADWGNLPAVCFSVLGHVGEPTGCVLAEHNGLFCIYWVAGDSLCFSE